MLTSGDIVQLDLGTAEGSAAGLRRPAVVVTADRILRADPIVIQVVPLTTTLRDYDTEVTVAPDTGTGLESASAAVLLDC